MARPRIHCHSFLGYIARMPRIEVAVVPSAVDPQALHGRVAVVIDALRGATSVLACLHAGAKEVRLFARVDEVRDAGQEFNRDEVVLAGESDGQRPGDFDLGNSPDDFVARRVEGKTVLLHAPNATPAYHHSLAAQTRYISSLANLTVQAGALINSRLDLVMICCGWQGQVAEEDGFVAGALIDRLLENPAFELAASGEFAQDLFINNRNRAREVFMRSPGAANLFNSGLVQDFDLCLTHDLYPVLAVIQDHPPRINARK